MNRTTVLTAAAAMIMVAHPASAQDSRPEQMGCQRLIPASAELSEQPDVLYARAACTATRAGVASPANGNLSREELLSILMLMSLQHSPASHS